MSSGSESDEDYVPGEPEQVSEEDSADEETDLQYDKELEHKAKKRKTTEQVQGKKRTKIVNGIKEIPTNDTKDEGKVPEATADTEEEKKREEDLWSKFLEGTETKPKSTSKNASQTINSSRNSSDTSDKDKLKSKQTEHSKSSAEEEKNRERRIFEFAGETLVVENNVIKEKLKTTGTAAGVSDSGGTSSRRGGLSGVLGVLNRKNKLSTLEKSKLDWETFKKEEGIEDEIKSHNKGKDGYLDRQDFLERADYRQYEIERDLRMSRRSNR